MPPSPAAQQWQTTVRDHLDALSPVLVDVLAALIRQPLPAEVRCVDFEVFCDGFTSGFPVRAFFLDEDGAEVVAPDGGDAKPPWTVPHGLLAIERIYPEEAERWVETVDPELDHGTLAGDAALAWFADCWRRAGGQEFARDATIGLHEDARRYDLVRQAWRVGEGR